MTSHFFGVDNFVFIIEETLLWGRNVPKKSRIIWMAYYILKIITTFSVIKNTIISIQSKYVNVNFECTWR